MDFLPYLLKDRFNLPQNLVVPKSDNPQTPISKKVRPLFIMAPIIPMLPTVHFDHQRGFMTVKVRDIRGDGVLPSEFKACQTAATQETP